LNRQIVIIPTTPSQFPFLIFTLEQKLSSVRAPSSYLLFSPSKVEIGPPGTTSPLPPHLHLGTRQMSRNSPHSTFFFRLPTPTSSSTFFFSCVEKKISPHAPFPSSHSRVLQNLLLFPKCDPFPLPLPPIPPVCCLCWT